MELSRCETKITLNYIMYFFRNEWGLITIKRLNNYMPTRWNIRDFGDCFYYCRCYQYGHKWIWDKPYSIVMSEVI